MGGNAIFTIISKNYISYARVLMKSFLKFHSDFDCFVLLVDKIQDYFDPSKEAFTTIELEQLQIPDRETFAFKYTIMELNTAAKPFFFEYLFKEYQYDKVIYFDPDILILRELSHLIEILGTYSVILTPHLTSPIPDDGKQISEIDILKAGCYNLGFIGLANYWRTRGFLKWWQDRLLKYCFSAPEVGLFVDQKWIDLVPPMYEDVYILKHPGYNTAYWNLHERKIDLSHDDYDVNSKPLFFYHFSGIDIYHLDSISKYQNRYRLDDIENLRGLFEKYKELLKDQGYWNSKDWPYFYGFFDNGAKIQDIVRQIYGSLGEKTKSFGDPYTTSDERSFFRWLNAPFNRHSRVTNLLYYIYSARIDLQKAFSEIEGEGENRLIGWALSSLPREYGLEEIFLDPLRKDIRIEPNPANVQLTMPMNRLESLLWKYGMRYASIIKRMPWVKEIAQKEYLRLYRKRTVYRNGQAVLHRQNQLGASEFRKETMSMVPPNEIGVNVAGYLDTESGVGEAGRGMIRSLEKASVRFALNNIEQQWLRRNDKTYTNFSTENTYKINLLHVNADQVPNVFVQLGENYFNGKYNVGYWFWELSNFPRKWDGSFRYFNEIWVASDFLLDALSQVSPVPVVKIPISIGFEARGLLDRKALGIPERSFVFLNIFDFQSFAERKNPFALIEAFRRFYHDFSSREGLLLLKMTNTAADPVLLGEIKAKMSGLPIRIIDTYFDKNDIYDLLLLSDCYVSLHRSEGFGLPLAEAMYLRKPVIATGYSGNMDFMNINNSFLVKYSLIEIKKDVGPYEKGNVWADPDILHAAELMRCVYENRESAQEMGARASEDIKNLLDPVALGKRIKGRIDRMSSVL